MKQKITNYIRAGYPLLQVTSHEEMRVLREIEGAVTELNSKIADESEQYSLYVWTITSGIQKRALAGTQPETISETEDPVAMAKAFASLPKRSVLVALDYHYFTAEPSPGLVRVLKEDFEIGKAQNRCLIGVGCSGKLALELQKYITLIDYKLPTRDELRNVVDVIERGAGLDTSKYIDALLDAASGLTTTEAEDAMALAFIESGKLAITPAIVAREKAQTVRKNGILEIVDTPVNADSIGGLSNLKAWLKMRRMAFSQKAKEFGLPAPKGCLTVGVPGTGKSLTAKAAASILGIPLLKLDAGKLFGSLVGQSESNMRAVIETAEAVAPCVLWIDELERAFSGTDSSSQTNGGTTDRVFGTMLNWMSEKTSPVFIFATANDVSKLPAQFLRLGRWDALWTVDIPTEVERREIVSIQLSNLNRPNLFTAEQINAIAKHTPQFTGSEIAAVFVEALNVALFYDRELTVGDVLDVAANVVPLAKSMADQVKAMQEWGKGRARPASATIAQKTIENIRNIMNS